MSVSKWAWTESCSNENCCGECDLCNHLNDNDEMTRFRHLLNENGIKWIDASSMMPDKRLSKYNIVRTHFSYNGYKWSVIHGYGTYGGHNFITGENDDLLELMSDAVNNGEPIGWLTAEDVFEYVKKGDANEDNCKQ